MSTSRGVVRRATLAEALHRLLEAEGAETVLAALERLMARGLKDSASRLLVELGP